MKAIPAIPKVILFYLKTAACFSSIPALPGAPATMRPPIWHHAVPRTAAPLWSKDDTEVVPNEGAMNVMSVSLLRLQDDSIALFYLRKNREDELSSRHAHFP